MYIANMSQPPLRTSHLLPTTAATLLVLVASLYACGTRGDIDLPDASIDASLPSDAADATSRDGASDARGDAAPDAAADAAFDAMPDAIIDGSFDAPLEAAIDASTDAGLDGSASLPAGTATETANQSALTTLADGLELSTPATGPNPVGAFNGGGTGNKLFLGFSGFAGTSPLALSAITLRARRDRGNAQLYLNLQVDCDGDGVFDPSVDGIVVVDSGMVPALALGATFTDVTILASDPVFTIVGGGLFPNGQSKCGLYSHLGNEGRPLTDLPPTAVLWDGSTGDNGMPKNKVMPSVLWVLGDSSNLQDLAVTVASASFGPASYVFTP